jgi:hypothetical protein
VNHLHKNRDEAMSCYGYTVGAHGANHFQESSDAGQSLCTNDCSNDSVRYERPQLEKGAESAKDSAPEFPLGLDFMPQSEGPSLVDQLITSTSLIVDREMAEPSDFDHDSFAASEFAAGLGGGR